VADTPKSILTLSIIGQAFPDHASLAALTRFSLARDEIPHAEIEDLLRSINRRFDRFPMKARALHLYTNNRIQLLGNKETVVVPAMLPAWRVATTHGVAAYVNAVPYVPAAGAAAMDVRRLFGLILAGAVLVDTLELWPRVSSSLALAKAGALVYSRMMFKVVDRIAGTGADRMRSDQVKYVFAKYYLLNMMGMDPSEATEALAQSVTSGTTVPGLQAFENAVAAGTDSADQGALYGQGLLDFLRAVSLADSWLGRLTARGFLQAFAAMYGAPAMLASEDFGFFMVALVLHQSGSEIINSYAFDPIYGSEGEEVIAEFARLSA
jgi:hypothetical protein